MRRPLASAVTLAATIAAGVLVAQPAAASPTDYVALGDSFAAGVGAGPYRDQTCKQSQSDSYPELWVSTRGRSSFGQVIDNACSGATTSDVLANQLNGLSDSTGWVTVTVGGNDARFIEVMSVCLIPGQESACVSATLQAGDQARQNLPSSLDSLYGEIRRRAPRARVVVMGYPRLVNASASGSCGLLDLNARERTAMNVTADVLSDVIKDRAVRAGFAYVDVRSTFDGHGACGPSAWLNGFILGEVTASFHPNKSGYQAYGRMLSAAAGSL